MPARKKTASPATTETKTAEKPKVTKRPRTEKESAEKPKTEQKPSHELKTEQKPPQEQKKITKHESFIWRGSVSMEGAGYMKGFIDGSMRLLSQRDYAEIFNLSPMGIRHHIGSSNGPYKEPSPEIRKKFIAYLLKFLENGEPIDLSAKERKVWMFAGQYEETTPGRYGQKRYQTWR